MKSLDVIFRPRSVAVVGASTRKGSLGREIFEKLLKTEFKGPVYPVNPGASYIHSVKAYPSISKIPDGVDLAVIVVPKETVLDVVRECAESGVKGLVVITAGFKETGPAGARVEQEMVAIVRAHNMRMIGPNCMGIYNLASDIRLDATFAPIVPSAGSIVVASQSGALGQTVLEHASDLNLGVSMFVSVGNKADVSGNDLLEYWKDDGSVGVILMYLESFGEPERFVRLAKEVSARKPIVVVKSGRTSSGARAATSHTGALAGLDVAYDALFRQCGIIRADTIKEMFDYAMGLANVPLPLGNRIAIVTNAGGPGIMAADACESCGLEVTELSESTKQALRTKLVADASVTNPVDLLAGAQPEDFQFALAKVLLDDNVDAAIVIFVAPIITNPTQVAVKISEAAEGFEKPVLGCFMGVKGVAQGIQELHRQRIPAFPFPESAARTLAAMVDYGKWRNQKIGVIEHYSVDKPTAVQVVSDAVSADRPYLSTEDAFRVLNAYGIPTAPFRLCRSSNELESACADLKFPLVLKSAADKVIHKSEIGGVKLGLEDQEAVFEAHADMEMALENHGVAREDRKYLVQEMITGGKEVIMGLNRIDRLGTLLAFGLGGVYVEVLGDVAFRLAPLTDQDAEEMIQEIRGYPILAGIRGEAGVDLHVLSATLMRLSQLALDIPQIRELDLNPFLAFTDPDRCVVVDARIRVGQAGV